MTKPRSFREASGLIVQEFRSNETLTVLMAFVDCVAGFSFLPVLLLESPSFPFATGTGLCIGMGLGVIAGDAGILIPSLTAL